MAQAKTKKILWRSFFALVILVFIGLLVQPNPYFRKALWHLTANTDDYKIFPNRKIKAATKPRVLVKSNTYNTYNLSDKESEVLQYFKTKSFLVLHNDSILFESYYGNFTDTSICNSFSMAKSIVSLLIGVARDEGHIRSYNDPIINYIPEMDPANEDIRIDNLLNMSSGLKWNESYWNPFSATTRAYYGNNIEKLVTSLKSEEKPAKYFNYLSANTQLLGIILKNSTGETLSEYAQRKLWQPIGAEHFALWSIDRPDGMEKAYCCFNATARDFARVGQLILHEGYYNNQQIIDSAYIQKIKTPAYHLKDDAQNPVDFYAAQWWLANYKDLDIIYARGILGQYIIIVPEKELVIVRLGDKRSKKRENHHPLDFYKYLELGLNIIEKS